MVIERKFASLSERNYLVWIILSFVYLSPFKNYKMCRNTKKPAEKQAFCIKEA